MQDASANPGQSSGANGNGSEREADLERVRAEILASSPDVVVANHCFGLFELAAIYLSDTPPNLKAASLAIDALAGLSEAVAGRLGTHETEIKDAVSQLRLAYVQLSTIADQSTQDQV